MNRLKISEYVDILYPEHMKKSEIALNIGSTIKQLDYAIKTDNMKFEIKKKLIRLAVNNMPKKAKEEQADENR